jgi:hypothetical protein
MANLLSTIVSGRLSMGSNTATPYLTTAPDGIVFGGNEVGNAYRLYTDLENIGGNYTKLNIAWHTGIKIGAHLNYGGTRFYNDSPASGTEIFSVGKGDSNVRVVNTLFIGGNTAIHAGNIGSQSVSYASTSGTFSTDWTNYKGVTENAVAGELMWKNYGNNHTIFDASNSTSPTGSAVNNTNSDIAWTGTYPTLMGWNGNSTYGVRVDSARVADSAGAISGLVVGDFVRAYPTGAGNIDSDWGQSFKTFDPIPSGTPPLQSPNIRTINIGDSYARRTQLAFDYSSDVAYFRRRTETGWFTWREFIHSGNIASQSVNYATTAGTLTSINISQFTNDSGYLTSATVGNMTRLWAESHPTDYYVRANWTGTYWQLTSNHPSPVQVGYADSAGSAGAVAWGNVSSKPSNIMFYEGFTLDANTMSSNSTGFTYSVNAPFTGPIARFSTGGGYDLWLGGSYNGGGNTFFLRTRDGDAATLNPWREIITSGNIGSQSVSNATTANGANGNFYIDDNYGNTVVGLYDSTRYQGVFAMGDAYKLPANGTTTGSLYGLAWSHPNAGGVAGNLNTHGLLVMENGTFLAAISGSIRSRDDMRAPIFYDSQDTAYYVDPNGNSYLSTLRVANASSGVSLHVGLGSTHGVYTLDDARKYLVVSAEFYPHMAIVASGSNNTNHGAVFSFVGTEGSSPRQWNLGIPNQNPFIFSIGYNTNNDTNPHYGVGDGWSSNDADHARLSIDRSGNTKIRGMLYVNGTSGGISTGSAVIHAGNIGSQSVASAGNADTVDGFHASVAGTANTIPTRNSSGYLIPENWIQLNGAYGLYSPTNDAHLRPNSGSYGSWLVTGSRNSWRGLEFDSGSNGNVSLMVNVTSNTTGFHNNSYGWQFYWEGGTLYCSKNAYGAGTNATVLDSVNFTNYAWPLEGGWKPASLASSTRLRGATSPDGGEFALAYSGGQIHPYADGFFYQNEGAYRVIDTNSVGSYAPTLTGGGASGSWGISVTGSAASSGRSSSLDIVGYGDGNMTYYQSSGTFAGYSGWAGYFVSNHGNGSNYYNQTIITPFWSPPQYSRLQGGTFVGPYTFWSTENLNDYAPNMNQYVRTTDNVTFNTTTSPTILVNGHSDNTKGYRIHNTSGSSVSAMFTNSSNQLVIAAGAVDQINLNKKVYVNGVALGVNVAPSATAGRIDASNDIVAFSSSDERLKDNITPIENALDKVKSLTGVEFDWKPEHKEAHGHEGHDTGIIAQQVLGVMPSAVRTNDTGYLAVRYEKLIGLLIEANKELAARVEELEKKIG